VNDAGSTWCSSQTGHQFCDDFDRDPFDKLWVRFERMGTVTTNVTDFVSAPRSMTGTVSAGSGTSTIPLQGTLGHVINAAPGSVEASFSMRLRTPTTAFTAADTAVVATVAAGDTNFIFLQYTSSGYVLISGTVTDGGLHTANVTMPPKLDEWVSVQIDVDFKTDNTGVVDVHLDGQPAGRIDSIATLAGAIPPTVSLGLGPTVYQQSTGLVVSYDNVLFDNR
jgi:hypothetical protein